MAVSIPFNAAGSLLPSSFLSYTVRAKPANLVVKSGCMR